jgi:hypothetical protein
MSLVKDSMGRKKQSVAELSRKKQWRCLKAVNYEAECLALL